MVSIERNLVVLIRLINLLIKKKYTIRKTLLKYRLSIMNAFNRDPYTCPRCGYMLNYLFRNDWRLTMFDFDNFPIKLSGKTVDYICPKCKI